jgi:nicotinamidase/pyrazinamidase
MVSRDVIFWDVDTQRDFMLAGGKLYVPGAEKIIPNLRRLTNAAREGAVLLVSSACAHTPDDEEFREWPPHCVKGTPGQEKIPETRTRPVWVVPNRPDADLPKSFDKPQQVILEKQKLDVFSNPNTDGLLERLASFAKKDAEFVVFGVVTEYCVQCAARGLLDRGKRVALVTDAIQTLDPAKGKQTLDELVGRNARLVTTDQVLALLSPISSVMR